MTITLEALQAAVNVLSEAKEQLDSIALSAELKTRSEQEMLSGRQALLAKFNIREVLAVRSQRIADLDAALTAHRAEEDELRRHKAEYADRIKAARRTVDEIMAMALVNGELAGSNDKARAAAEIKYRREDPTCRAAVAALEAAETEDLTWQYEQRVKETSDRVKLAKALLDESEDKLHLIEASIRLLAS